MSPLLQVFRATLSLALLVLIGGCANTDVNPPRVWGVTYTLTVTGQGTVTQLMYFDGTQNNVVSNPVNGWTINFPVVGGTAVNMSTQGTVNNGMIGIAISADAVGKNPVGGSDACAESAGSATACALSIPSLSLPN